jgi:prepilin-type processing-associated H-X9-DG protein
MSPVGMTGISSQRSKIGIKHVTDGTANTYLIGEKFLMPAKYETGDDAGDNETWCTGFNNDNYRFAYDPPARDFDPRNIRECTRQIFGSAHDAGFHMSWCDGHVSMLSYDIELLVHRGNANRADDGEPLQLTAPYAPVCPSGGQ